MDLQHQQPTSSMLEQLKLENMVLLKERHFLEHSLDARGDVSARLLTARHNTTSTDCQLLRDYLEAMRLGVPARCTSLKEELRQMVTEAETKANNLEALLREVRKEVSLILAFAEHVK